MGSKVSRPTCLTSRELVGYHAKEFVWQVVPFSVISAKAKAADLCKSTLSEYASVERARRGSPSKKFVLLRSVQSVSILHLGGNFNAGHYFQENEVAQ